MDFRTTRHSRTARAILDVANESGSDLIATETHGSGRSKRLLVGRVSEKMICASKAPMLMTGLTSTNGSTLDRRRSTPQPTTRTSGVRNKRSSRFSYAPF
jgi:hypothetical protein